MMLLRLLRRLPVILSGSLGLSAGSVESGSLGLSARSVESTALLVVLLALFRSDAFVVSASLLSMLRRLLLLELILREDVATL